MKTVLLGFAALLVLRAALRPVSTQILNLLRV